MGNIKITPQWILQNFVFDYNLDGKGKVQFSTFDYIDTNWVSLAIETLGITYEIIDECNDNHYEFKWLVSIDDLKTDCFDLYSEFKRLESEGISMWAYPKF